MPLIISVPKLSHTCVSQHVWVCGYQARWVSSCVNPHLGLRPPPPPWFTEHGHCPGANCCPIPKSGGGRKAHTWHSSPPLSLHTRVHTNPHTLKLLFTLHPYSPCNAHTHFLPLRLPSSPLTSPLRAPLSTQVLSAYKSEMEIPLYF